MTKLNNEWQAKGVEVTCNGRMVATTFGGDLYKHCTDFDAQQAFDHAKLIAAAPELYEALKEITDWLAEVADCPEMLERCEAALEKARGEAWA
jgi:hypothetical protein